jgi:hypothetical protein
MAYGYEVKEPNDRKVQASKAFLQITGETSLPGTLLVNDLPYREYSLQFGIGLARHSFIISQYDTL